MCIQQIMSLKKLQSEIFIPRDTKKICFTAVEDFAGGSSYSLFLN